MSLGNDRENDPKYEYDYPEEKNKTQKTMIKTAKVAQVVSTKPFNGSHGTIIYNNLVLDNGDKINIGKKTEMQVGWEISYSLTGGDDGQQEYKRAKAEKKPDAPQNNNNAGGQGRQFTADPKKQASIERQTALKEANLFHATHGFKTSELESMLGELVFTAEYLFEKYLSK